MVHDSRDGLPLIVANVRAGAVIQQRDSTLFVLRQAVQGCVVQRGVAIHVLKIQYGVPILPQDAF